MEKQLSRFTRRHIGPSEAEQAEMLQTLGYETLDALIADAIPADVCASRPLNLPQPLEETQALARLREFAGQNEVWRSFLGMGYYDCAVPPVLQRNILENPGWYTQYTPYQAEISQGRLEALLIFQTMVSDLTGMEVSNASLLDEATACAEALTFCANIARGRNRFIVDYGVHPQNGAVVQTRARPLDFEVIQANAFSQSFDDRTLGVLVQYPDTHGRIRDLRALADAVHAAGGLLVVATDLLALTLMTPPGEMGADVAVGSSQRFGTPMGYGGPHAGFFAVNSKHQRKLPGRLVGVSRDVHGNPALRLALQAREQHIRREKATSNICTAQALPAIMSAMYAVYHGPEGLRAIARHVRAMTALLTDGLQRLGVPYDEGPHFDTLLIRPGEQRCEATLQLAASRRLLLRRVGTDGIGLSLDETTTRTEVADLLRCFAGGPRLSFRISELSNVPADLPAPLMRTSPYLDHPVFHRYHAEHEMLRYLKRLESRDLSLTTSMIPLGSCTMKLNAAVEMQAITWPQFASLHPFAPVEHAQGYMQLCEELEKALCEITGLAACSLQPNAGSQGEYAGLLAIRSHHNNQSQSGRRICLIPKSAHGTNFASAAMAGLKVVSVDCDRAGNIDLDDLRAKADQHGDDLAALMITWPSTHGVFEPTVREVCEIVHARGGQVYLDGANMNAQVGLCRPGELGADVVHLNLHKTFAIPHGGGGPGVGPICVAEHLVDYLPNHPLAATGGKQSMGPIAGAPWGSANVLPISWAYIALLGGSGLKRASEVAILNANYVARRLADAFPTLYAGPRGLVAHECILDLREHRKATEVDAEDVCKRLMDYGYHAPTQSWPVPGTLMVEPTESESQAELDRFCQAMLHIHDELTAISEGRADKSDNPLKNAPHTALSVTADNWPHRYTRRDAAYPATWLEAHKFWPFVGRVDAAFGDRNLVSVFPPEQSVT